MRTAAIERELGRVEDALRPAAVEPLLQRCGSAVLVRRAAPEPAEQGRHLPQGLRPPRLLERRGPRHVRRPVARQLHRAGGRSGLRRDRVDRDAGCAGDRPAAAKQGIPERQLWLQCVRHHCADHRSRWHCSGCVVYVCEQLGCHREV